MLTIKEIFEKKENELLENGSQELYGYYIKPYNGFVDLRYELLQNTLLDEDEYDIYVNGGHITLRIMKAETEIKLLAIQNSKVDEEKIKEFTHRISHFVKRYGKEKLIEILEDKNIIEKQAE